MHLLYGICKCLRIGLNLLNLFWILKVDFFFKSLIFFYNLQYKIFVKFILLYIFII